MSQSTSELQNSFWKPIFSQEIILPEDQLKTYIVHPKQSNPMKQQIARTGKVDSVDLNYFDPEQTVLESVKKRFPFFY
ncbi:MAG: hypothetical protein DRO88_01360 [Promethearchaeia archaeon]|nr:MAG: hypothetical protein DRO88_01360 [Candidatus Lokiarchaeia archaeon]